MMDFREQHLGPLANHNPRSEINRLILKAVTTVCHQTFGKQRLQEKWRISLSYSRIWVNPCQGHWSLRRNYRKWYRGPAGWAQPGLYTCESCAGQTGAGRGSSHSEEEAGLHHCWYWALWPQRTVRATEGEPGSPAAALPSPPPTHRAPAEACGKAWHLVGERAALGSVVELIKCENTWLCSDEPKQNKIERERTKVKVVSKHTRGILGVC